MPSWNCCVMNCKNNTHGPLRFFSFPKDEERRQLWAESCGRQNWYPTDLSRICEVHFDKSQFEQNQGDGKKLLKWSAIPRMYEEWTGHTTSPNEEHFQKSDEYDDAAEDGGAFSDYRYTEDEMEDTTFLDDGSSVHGIEGMSKSELTKRERLKRKRAAPDNELDSEEYQSSNTGNSAISIANRGRKKVYAFERTDELEDELSRIKADIKRLMGDVDNGKASNAFPASHNITGGTTHPRFFSPISAMNKRTSPGTVSLSPSSVNKHNLQNSNSTSSQSRQQQANQFNKSPVRKLGAKTEENPSVLSTRLPKEVISYNKSSFVPSPAKTQAALAKMRSTKQLQRIENARKIESNTIASSQFPKNQSHSGTASENVEESIQRTTRKKNVNVSSKQDVLLKEILGNTKSDPKRNLSTKAGRAPGVLTQFTKNALDRHTPGEGISSQISEPSSIEKVRSVPINIPRTPSKAVREVKKTPLQIGKDTTETKNTLPRIVRVQSLNLLKGATEIKGPPSRTGAAQSSTLKDVARVSETTSVTNKVENRSSTVGKVVLPRIIQVQSVGSLKSVTRTEDAQSRGSQKSAREINENPLRTDKEQRNSLSKDTAEIKDSSSKTDETQSRSSLKVTSETPLKTSKVQKEGMRESENAPEVGVRSCEVRSGSETNSNVANPPESKSAQLKKLLASMLSLEEDMFSDESDHEMLKDSNENTKKKRKKKSEVAVQADDSDSEVTVLKAEITKLTKQLEEKNKTIQQLQQSLAAVLPPGQIIMLESENDEKYMIFNQQEAPS